jgi:cytochrome oxidase Cu insertion factor (SCO1/SenC/PrrC family)
MKKVFLHSSIAAIALTIGLTAIPATGYGQSAKFNEFPEKFPKAGDIAPDFTLKTRDGDEFNLAEAVAKQPVVIEFGSYT